MKASIENPRIHPDYLIGNNTEGLVFKDGPLAEFEPFEYVLQGYDASTGEDPTEYTIRKSESIHIDVTLTVIVNDFFCL